MTAFGSGRSDEGGASVDARLRALERQLDRSLALLAGRTGRLDTRLARRLRNKLADTSRALERPFVCEMCGASYRFPGELDDHRWHLHGVYR